jgi:hypothetical protein
MLKTEKMNAGIGEQTNRPGVAGWIKKHYTRQGLWSLYLICAFPLHAWTLILAFRDVSWVTDRTNSWDAVGVVSYGLMFTFVESVLLFAVMVLLGYLVSTYWDAERRVALLSVLALIASVWAMLEQLFFLMGTGLPGWSIDLLIRSSHPLRTFYVLLIGLVGATVLGPALLVLRSQRVYAAVRALIERLSVLTIFYLVLDAIGVVIVIVRNL